MRIVVVTGLSGSGKSTAIRALEDIGYYAIDNLPVGLLDKLTKLFHDSTGIEKLAVVVDARAAQLSAGSSDPEKSELDVVPMALDLLRDAGHDVDMLYLDAADKVVERRYSETRRRHPLGKDGSVSDGIAAERRLVYPLRQSATLVIDTTGLSVHDLKRDVQKAYSDPDATIQLAVTVLSFGFKNGVPNDVDVMFDVRFLPNPFFVEDLRDQCGLDPAVAAYVLNREETRIFLEKIQDLFEFLLPQFEHEGKAYLKVAIGCTGGRHRSVAVAEAFHGWLQSQGRRAHVRHRDLKARDLKRHRKPLDREDSLATIERSE